MRAGTLPSVAVILACVATADADTPTKNRKDESAGPPHVFVPSAGFKRMFRPDTGEAAPVPAVVGGRRGAPSAAPQKDARNRKERRVPVILLRYNDVAVRYQAWSYQVRLFGDEAEPKALRADRRTVRNYYRDMSRGDFDLTGRVWGWFDLPKARAAYTAVDQPLSPLELLKDGLSVADKQIDFGKYDNDGPDGEPNSGDDDGIVDTLIAVHAEPSKENGGGFYNSHSQLYKKLNGGKFYETDDKRTKSTNPDSPFAKKGLPDRIVVDDYALLPGLSAAETDNGETRPPIIEVGVFCHELGHALGLPDLYDRTDPRTHGLGTFCCMSRGMYGGDMDHPETPVALSAWCRAYLKWVEVETLNDGNHDLSKPIVFLPAHSEKAKVFRIDINGTDKREYFLIEYRDRQKVSGRVNWDEKLPAAGLFVWHIDEKVGRNRQANPDWPFAEPDEGQNDDASAPMAAPNPSGDSPPGNRQSFVFPEKHALVALVQQDGKQHLEDLNFGNEGDEADVLREGESLGDDPELKKGLRGYDGVPTTAQITNVHFGPNGEGGTFELLFQSGSGSPLAPPDSEIAFRKILGDIEKLLDEGKDVPEDKQKEAASAPQYLIDTAVTRDTADKIQEYIQKFRVIQEFRVDSPTPTPVERDLRSLLTRQQSPGAVRVRFDPSRTRVERLEPLNIPARSTTFFEDAQRMASGDLKPLIGSDIVLVQVTPRDALAPQQRFEQFVQVGSERLPLLGRGFQGPSIGVSLYYKKDRAELFKVVNDTVRPEELRFDPTVKDSGPVSALDRTKSWANASRGQVVGDPRKGIYIDYYKDPTNLGPAFARLAYQVSFRNNTGQTTSVYVILRTSEVVQQ
jgi:M6 family metalloprotease-like protein